jgi:penicillin-binding protein 1B
MFERLTHPAPKRFPRPRWRARHEKLVLVTFGIVAAALWVATVGAVASFWMTTSSLANRSSGSPSRLYGRPLQLHTGDAVTSERLAENLTFHDYSEVASDAELKSGAFLRRATGEFVLRRRPGPVAPAAGAGEIDGSVVIFVDRGRIVRLTEDGQERSDIALDPPHLASFLGPHQRERRPVALRDLPLDLLHAVLAAEDATYFDHRGVSIPGIVRAAWVNARAGEVRQGASTITQQLARLVYLDPERTFARKAREAVLAALLEIRYPKSRLLDVYLNEIYLGRLGGADLIGVGAAAHAFFGQRPERLELHEAALLAGMIRSPGRYSPVHHPEAARQRRDHVLARMAELGWISAVQLETARAAPVALALHPAPERGDFGWFAALAAAEARVRFGAVRLDTQGLTLLSTIDVADQRRAAAAMREGLTELEDKRASAAGLEAALVSIDPADGSILAYLGGRDFAKSEFDRAARARRQAGSIFKPVVLASILQSGVTLADRVADSPVVVILANSRWRPENFDRGYRGPVSVRTAVEQSLNIPMARLALANGLGPIAQLADRFGLGAPEPRPALSLGAIDVVPLDVAAAYALFANGGERPTPHALDALLDANGARLDGAPFVPRRRVLDEGTSYLVTSTLAGAITRGTGAGVRRFGLADPLAGKTGTSDQQRDSWFAGYAQERSTVVWVGFDDNSPTRFPGSRGALPVWARFMAAVRPADGYHLPRRPDGIVTAKIDPETGYLASPACPSAVEELFAPGREPIEICPLHLDPFVLADYPGGAHASATTLPPDAATFEQSPAEIAWSDTIAMERTAAGPGEPRIVIRWVPVQRAAQTIPLPPRAPAVQPPGDPVEEE